MTQVSLPQAGSGVGDSGPYTADDWAKLFEVVFTGDQAATQGVLRNYLNELESTRFGVTISIDTGAGFCYGHWIENDAIVDITVDACAGVQTRWDRIVLVQNETAVAYNTNLLLPAAYAAGVPRNSCRIAILRGVCGDAGALPRDLVTGPNYYMVELARYQVTGGNVGIVTDRRGYTNFSTEVGADWIEDRTRQFFVPALIGYNATDLSDIILSSSGVTTESLHLVLPDDAACRTYGRFMMPADYLSGLTITPVVTAQAAGNIYGYSWAAGGVCGNWANGSGGGPVASGFEAVACTGAITYSCLEALSFLSVVPDCLVILEYLRDGTNILDTINAAVWFCGWIVEYTADS